LPVRRLVGLVLGVAMAAGLPGSAPAQGQPPATPKGVEARRPLGRYAGGRVVTVAADRLVVAGKVRGGQAAEWTFAIDPATKVRKAGKHIAATDLAPGDPVHVRYHAEQGRNVADEVMVRAPRKAPPAARDK
jgi:hypothetical protein